jgi:hypothetical protein
MLQAHPVILDIGYPIWWADPVISHIMHGGTHPVISDIAYPDR